MKTTVLPDIRPAAAANVPDVAGEEFVMPVSVAQQRFWVLDQLASGNSALNIPLALELKGPLKIDVLQRAINAVIDRHETLRTTFIWQEDEVKQVIHSDVRFHLEHKDLTDVPEDQRPVRLLEEMNKEAVRPLSLTQAPIFRAKLIKFETHEHALFLTLHHIICDGWANGIIVREIGVFYHAFLTGKKADLPALPIQYADYALWQKDWLKSPDFQKQLGYWEKELSGGLPTLDFPTDHPRKTGRMFPSHIESLLLPLRLSDGIKRMCQELDITVFMVLFAAYTCLIHRYTGQSRFVVGTTVANRPRPELEHLIGEFANPMILRADLANAPTFRELAHRVRDISLGAMSHQEVPFELILERVETKSGGGEKPAIQAFFLFQKAFMHPAQYDDLSIRPHRSVSPGTTFEFTLAIVERGEGIRLQFEYNTELFEKETVRRLLRHFQVLLESAIENPDATVGDLMLLSEEEIAKIVPAAPTAAKDDRPDVDLGSALKNLQIQMEEYFREAANPEAALLKPPAGATPFVLDKQLHLLPAGVPGEIHLGGITSGITIGTVPLSGPRDVPDPVPLVRTDFIGRYRDDGRIEILGRAADFGEVNGFRVNFRQVQAILQRHPDVLDASAAIFPQPKSGGNQLVCYVVAKTGATPSEKTLRESLKGKVSDFVLPSHIITVPAITRDPWGEVIPDSLPAPAAPAKRKNEDKVPLEAILYQQLIDIWTDILKIPIVTIEDNFFELGGTSLQALRMMVQIEKLCGRSLPLTLLLKGATISNLARHIVEAKGDSPTAIITVQGKGKRAPIFFLHGDWAGGGFYCGRLSEFLGEDQPFYALPPYRHGQDSVLSMEEMAAQHIIAIKALKPKGPYILGGYCIGATVAVEMARQLVVSGETVSQLVLIDLPLRAAPWLRLAWPLLDGVGNLLGWDLQKKIFYFDLYAVSFARWLNRSPQSKMVTLGRRLGLTKRAGPTSMPGGEPGEGDMEILKSMDYAVYFLAYRLYHSRKLTAPTTLYFPEDTLTLRTRFSWLKRITSKHELNIKILPGDHHTCITKHTAVLAERMKATLDNVR